mmetsp:Transcript_105732/g.330684  ORF Transcript_105732/g.330684 Transcript_105732/m.330684 type:complete len:280 (+) Transcript_105732:1118-1957(+)
MWPTCLIVRMVGASRPASNTDAGGSLDPTALFQSKRIIASSASMALRSSAAVPLNSLNKNPIALRLRVVILSSTMQRTAWALASLGPTFWAARCDSMRRSFSKSIPSASGAAGGAAAGTSTAAAAAGASSPSVTPDSPGASSAWASLGFPLLSSFFMSLSSRKPITAPPSRPPTPYITVCHQGTPSAVAAVAFAAVTSDLTWASATSDLACAPDTSSEWGPASVRSGDQSGFLVRRFGTAAVTGTSALSTKPRRIGNFIAPPWAVGEGMLTEGAKLGRP